MKKKPNSKAKVTEKSEPVFLNVEAVSNILNHTEWTIRKWCREKKIQSVKIGKRILFRKEWIDEFIKKKERGSDE